MTAQLGIELRHLKTLQALRQTDSLVKAADVLHLTQSALSHQLKELEGRIGMELFVRKSRPIRFTSVGLRLLDLADEVLPLFSHAEQDIYRLSGGESGRLHMAIECHSCYQWLMPAIDSYRQHWPEVEMDFVTGFHFAPLPALARGELDLVITSDPNSASNLTYVPLFHHEMLLALSTRHQLVNRKWIKPQDLASETLITYPVESDRLDIFNRFLDPEGVEPDSVRTVELTLMMLQLVASQRGVCALPDWALAEHLEHQRIEARKLGRNGLWTTLYAAIRIEQQEHPYLIDFIETAKRTSLSHLSPRPSSVD